MKDEVLVTLQGPLRAQGPFVCHIRGEPQVAGLVNEDIEDMGSLFMRKEKSQRDRTTKVGLEWRRELATQLGEKLYTVVCSLKHGRIAGRKVQRVDDNQVTGMASVVGAVTQI